ncbi:hypothetical protein PQX77_010793 [Marasmius sp. AFHP31]|nr:hypothetical protein PQX77_010793 [Marasmius sp. AFHP31]
MNVARVGHAAALNSPARFQGGNTNRRQGWKGEKSTGAVSLGKNEIDEEKRPLRPTHFLSLPLGQHPELRSRVAKFQDALLNPHGSSSAVKGLHPSIVINPRRLHLTLGVMSLQKPKEGQGSSDTTPEKTVESALDLLRSLQSRLSEEGPVHIPLKQLGAFGSKKGARVLWVSPVEQAEDGETPDESSNREKLARICCKLHSRLKFSSIDSRSPCLALVHRTFKEAGYILDTRPLKVSIVLTFFVTSLLPLTQLHCTLINTSHRKPSSKRHILFSYDDILASQALHDIQILSAPETPDDTVATASPEVSRVAKPSEMASAETSSARVAQVDMGSYTVSEIQLCIMGSHGSEGEYVSVGGISLGDRP